MNFIGVVGQAVTAAATLLLLTKSFLYNKISGFVLTLVTCLDSSVFVPWWPTTVLSVRLLAEEGGVLTD